MKASKLTREELITLLTNLKDLDGVCIAIKNLLAGWLGSTGSLEEWDVEESIQQMRDAQKDSGVVLAGIMSTRDTAYVLKEEGKVIDKTIKLMRRLKEFGYETDNDRELRIAKMN